MKERENPIKALNSTIEFFTGPKFSCLIACTSADPDHFRLKAQ